MPTIAREAVRVAVVQSRIDQGAREENWKRALDLVMPTLDAGGTDLVVFPEAFATGVNFIVLRQLAEPVPDGPTVTGLRTLARDHGVHIVAGVLEAGPDGRVYDSAVLIDGAGEVRSTYRRRFLWVGERNYVRAGGQPSIVDTDLGRVGLIVGYDLCFPQASATFLEHDVDIIACPASVFAQLACSAPRLALARAMDHHCYTVYANAVGFHQFANMAYPGGSGVYVDPYFAQVRLGEGRRADLGTVATAPDGEQTVLTAPLYVADLRAARAQNLLPFRGDAEYDLEVAR